MTDKAAIWRTPTYHAVQLHAPHVGATALPVDALAGGSLPDGAPALAAAASRVTVTVVNQHLREELDVTVDCPGVATAVEGRLLTAGWPDEQNLVAEPDLVAPIDFSAEVDGPGRWRLQLPPHLVATVRLVRS
ncbi:MAG: hypothetical protein M3Q10_17620 [Chloroflexota bacterium]|nr:hypothetical protein [Chloroflexota bacterium]